MTDRTKLILQARRSGSCYGSGEPRWLEGRAKRPSKTVPQAEQQRQAAVKLLRRHGKENQRALNLARRLERCRKNKRCLSGACPICHRAYQRRFVGWANRFLKKDGRMFRVVSAIPAKGVSEGELK
jgi:hypothetical protein